MACASDGQSKGGSFWLCHREPCPSFGIPFTRNAGFVPLDNLFNQPNVDLDTWLTEMFSLTNESCPQCVLTPLFFQWTLYALLEFLTEKWSINVLNTLKILQIYAQKGGGSLFSFSPLQSVSSHSQDLTSKSVLILAKTVGCYARTSVMLVTQADVSAQLFRIQAPGSLFWKGWEMPPLVAVNIFPLAAKNVELSLEGPPTPKCLTIAAAKPSCWKKRTGRWGEGEQEWIFV